MDAITFRITSSKKQRFRELCRLNSTCMTTEIIRYINAYIDSHGPLPLEHKTPITMRYNENAATGDSTLKRSLLLPEIDDHQNHSLWAGEN